MIRVGFLIVIFDEVEGLRNLVHSLFSSGAVKGGVTAHLIIVSNSCKVDPKFLVEQARAEVSAFNFHEGFSFEVIPGSRNNLSEVIKSSGSYHHASAIHFGLTFFAENFDLICIVDPDIEFLPDYGYMNDFKKLSQYNFSGSVWDPMDATHFIDFPSPHFFAFSNNIFRLRLDFTSDPNRSKSIKKRIDRLKIIIDKFFSNKNSFLFKRLFSLLIVQFFGISGDTGYRNRYLFSGSSVFMFGFKPRQFDPLNQHFLKRLHKLKAHSALIRERISAISLAQKRFDDYMNEKNELYFFGKKPAMRHERRTLVKLREDESRILIANNITAFKNTLVGDLLFYRLLKNFYNVDFLVCAGGFSGCLNTKNRGDNFKDWMDHPGACERCKNNIDQLVKMHVDECDLVTVYNQTSYARNEISFDRSDINLLKSLSHRGISVGEHSYASTCRYFGYGRPEQFSNFTEVFEGFLQAAIQYCNQLMDLLERQKYDLVIVHHGIYVPQGIVVDIAKKLGVKIVTWNLGYRKKTFYFAVGDTYHKVFVKEKYNKKLLSSKDKSLLINYLESRSKASNDWVWFNTNTSTNLDTPFDQDLKKKLEKFDSRVIGVFLNVFWDAQIHFENNIFGDMYEFVKKIISIAPLYPEYLWVIRAHPGEVSGSTKASITVADSFGGQALPDNVIVIPANSPYSSYQLAKEMAFGISYSSKFTAEAVGLFDKLMIVCGEAFCKGKGFTIDPSSSDEMDHFIREAINRRLDIHGKQDRALEYLNYYFFEQLVTFDSLEYEIDGNFPKLVMPSSKGLKLQNQLSDKGMLFFLNLIRTTLKASEEVVSND